MKSLILAQIERWRHA